MRGRVKLTKLYVSKICATGKREMYRDTTVDGLVLRVSKDAKNKTWYFDYINKEKKRQLFKIGSLKLYDVESAKNEAKKLSSDVSSGLDPAKNKRESQLEAKLSQNRTIASFLEGDYDRQCLSLKRRGNEAKKRILSSWKQLLDTDMKKITESDVSKIISSRIHAGVKPTTINRDRTELVTLLNKAKEWKIIESNPLTNWKPLKVEKEIRVRYLNKEEKHRLKEALEAAPKYLKAMVLLAMYTGMRRGEIFTLTWDAINFSQRSLSLRASNTKANKSRIVYLNQSAIDVLTEWKKSRGNVSNIHDLVFSNPSTGRSYDNIKRSWGNVCKSAKLYNFRFHDLRHDFCSQLVMKGVPLTTIRDLAGHSTIEMTERYAHLAPSHLKEAIEKLSS